MTTRIPWLKAVLWLAVLVAVGMLLVYGRDLLLLVLVAAIIAYLLFPLVNNLERRGVGRTLAASIVFFGLSLILGVLGWLLIPLLAKQVAEWQEGLGNGSLYALLNQLEDEIAAYLPFIEPGTLGLSESVREALVVQKGHLLGYAGDALSVIGNLIVIPFVLFFLLRDGSGMMKKLVSLVPNRYFEFTMGVLYKIDEHLGGYLRGQSLVAVVVGLATILGLGLLGVDYYLMLGLFTGVANFIPYVGFIISAGLTLALCILTTGGMAQVPGIVILFAVVQTLENVVFQPWITARNVSLHPVTVLLAILLGGRFAGVLGMALAVPAMAVAKVIIVETAVTLRRFRL